MKFVPSKLFHAVVVTGAALTACAGSDDGTDQAPPPDEVAAIAEADAQTDELANPADPAVSVEAESSGTGTCPPGSERPFPPCFWIL